jgi:hypothetical protein
MAATVVRWLSFCLGDCLGFDIVQLVHNDARAQIDSSLPVGSDHAKIELQSVRQRRDTLGAACILGNNYRFSPVRHIVSDPFRNNRLCMEIVDRTFKKALHL